MRVSARAHISDRGTASPRNPTKEKQNVPTKCVEVIAPGVYTSKVLMSSNRSPSIFSGSCCIICLYIYSVTLARNIVSISRTNNVSVVFVTERLSRLYNFVIEKAYEMNYNELYLLILILLLRFLLRRIYKFFCK